MREVLAVAQRFLATVYRVNEAAFLVEIPCHDLLYQLAGIAALLSGRSRKLGFDFGCEKYFHVAQSTGKTRVWQGMHWNEETQGSRALLERNFYLRIVPGVAALTTVATLST